MGEDRLIEFQDLVEVVDGRHSLPVFIGIKGQSGVGIHKIDGAEVVEQEEMIPHLLLTIKQERV